MANQFVLALEQALEKYRVSFGHLPHQPQTPQPVENPGLDSGDANDGQKGHDANPKEKPQSAGTPHAPTSPSNQKNAAQPAPIADIYDNLKLPDDMLGGVYANMASISHTGSEFCFDFIAQFFPRSAVTARVYMTAPRVPELLNSLKRSISAN